MSQARRNLGLCGDQGDSKVRPKCDWSGVQSAYFEDLDWLPWGGGGGGVSVTTGVCVISD